MWSDMPGLKHIAAMALISPEVFAQHFYPASIYFDTSTPVPGLSGGAMFYMYPAIIVITFLICLCCLHQLIHMCRARTARGHPTLSTISGSIQNGSHGEPPPPYTFTDVRMDGSSAEQPSTNYPIYTKSPPANLELSSVSQNNYI
ncbi:uncharacterized protein LOC117327872 [Pecten maximus]|uniref:uncharacterized protein LOC117327872 n=1 Tax=Pecten maximus TaxID=6579 RepID=UPI001458F0C0|nr:uncharacterized protein LOC117327872 [Pecten maximus]